MAACSSSSTIYTPENEPYSPYHTEKFAGLPVKLCPCKDRLSLEQIAHLLGTSVFNEDTNSSSPAYKPRCPTCARVIQEIRIPKEIRSQFNRNPEQEQLGELDTASSEHYSPLEQMRYAYHYLTINNMLRKLQDPPLHAAEEEQPEAIEGQEEEAFPDDLPLVQNEADVDDGRCCRENRLCEMESLKIFLSGSCWLGSTGGAALGFISYLIYVGSHLQCNPFTTIACNISIGIGSFSTATFCFAPILYAGNGTLYRNDCGERLQAGDCWYGNECCTQFTDNYTRFWKG